MARLDIVLSGRDGRQEAGLRDLVRGDLLRMFVHAKLTFDLATLLLLVDSAFRPGPPPEGGSIPHLSGMSISSQNSLSRTVSNNWCTSL